jgi:hypothetical protein
MNTTSVRCLGINKDNTQCKKNTKNQSYYCNTHLYQIELKQIESEISNIQLESTNITNTDYNFFINTPLYKTYIIRYNLFELNSIIDYAISNTNYDLYLFIFQLLEAFKKLNFSKYIEICNLILDKLYEYIDSNNHISDIQYNRLESVLNSNLFKNNTQ